MKTTLKKLPFFFIGKKVTEERKENFKKLKHPILCKQLGREDTQSVWYTREHISKLLEEIDHAGGDGIRLHFGAYEKGHPLEGQLCLVMNVTRIKKQGKSQKRVNIFLEEELDYEERSKSDRFIKDSDPNVIKRDFNFGSPCPPRCEEESNIIQEN
ncbi:hypothetical protein ACQY1Q_12045 [Tenacibaculum sp. TC6]|uniref:hypothetical protein n=1 Tax=Tenacibaculum sp. TC6 TaxID=3423223 RepID=UPI003D36623E